MLKRAKISVHLRLSPVLFEVIKNGEGITYTLKIKYRVFPKYSVFFAKKKVRAISEVEPLLTGNRACGILFFIQTK